jgi:hypothetical protein
VVVADACTDQTASVAGATGARVIGIRARRVGAARAAGMRELLRLTSDADPAAVWLATTRRRHPGAAGLAAAPAHHALLAAATRAGCMVAQASDIAVETSGRRLARAPRGFGHLLRTLADQRVPAATPRPMPYAPDPGPAGGFAGWRSVPAGCV